MNIEQFVAQSEGTWRSMRSSHSLAFQQFEEVLSEIRIQKVNSEDPEVSNSSSPRQVTTACPYRRSKWNGKLKVTGSQM